MGNLGRKTQNRWNLAKICLSWLPFIMVSFCLAKVCLHIGSHWPQGELIGRPPSVLAEAISHPELSNCLANNPAPQRPASNDCWLLIAVRLIIWPSWQYLLCALQVRLTPTSLRMGVAQAWQILHRPKGCEPATLWFSNESSLTLFRHSSKFFYRLGVA